MKLKLAYGIPTEFEEQKRVAAFLDKRNVLWTATANGAGLGGGPMAWNKLKASGVKPGVPDILIFERRGDWCGMAIELKRSGFKSVRKSDRAIVQAEYLTAMKWRGWFVMFGSGADWTIPVVDWYLSLDK